ncbi:hypothetical protein [Phenylobacterium immobile]|uniref:hypothetical protein n=1 Tax=Phenylobacterium immobile TaxID=21 RepID=UPI000AF5AB5C|nr:hypothetical protein [Phenylobacterium immobile]
MQFLPPLESLPLNHLHRERVEKTFGVGRFQRIEHEMRGPQAASWRTVADAVSAEGGRAVSGWRVMLWPGLYVMAQAHAVWERPDGRLVDLSEKPVTDRQAYTTFVADRRVAAILADQSALIPERYHLISRSAPALRLIETLAEQYKAKESLREKLVEAGVVFGEDGAFDVPDDLIDLFNTQNAHARRAIFAMEACEELPKVAPIVRLP